MKTIKVSGKSKMYAISIEGDRSLPAFYDKLSDTINYLKNCIRNCAEWEVLFSVNMSERTKKQIINSL